MPSGLEAILVANRARLVRFLTLRGAGDMAEDLVQEVWIKAREQSAAPIANPEGYLFRIAHNVMIDWHRSGNQRELRERAWTDSQAGERLDQDTGPDAERSVIARSVLDRAIAEIDALGEPTRTIFRRFRIDGIAQRDIAGELGIALPTVEKHLQRAYKAMAALRHLLDMG